MDQVDLHEPATQQPRPSRRIRACKQCRTAKVRCSGMRPCERCTRRRDKCAFAADEAHVSVPERYLQDLQRQLAHFKASVMMTTTSTGTEERPVWRGSVSESETDPSVITPTSLDTRPATSARPARFAEIDPLPSFDASNTTPRQQSNSSVGLASGSTEKNGHESGNVPQAYNPLVAKDVAYVNGSDDRRLLFLGHTSTWSFCRRVFTLLEDAGSYSTTHRAPLNLDGAAFRLHWQPKTEVDASDLVKLPPADHAFLLYNTVKFRLGELFNVVDEDNFLRLFEEFHKQPLETAQKHRLWFVEYLIVLAFGKAFTSYADPTTVAPPGSDLASRALSLLPDVAFLQDDRPALLAMENFALIALYFQSIDMRSPAYQYIGQALRLSFHDGLHRRFPEDVMDACITRHCNNVWWTIYVLDQALTAGLGCPPTIPLSSITAPLPDTLSSSMSTKALALRSRLSQINSIIYSGIYSFDENLGSDFVSSITSVLHKLAEVSREIDEVISGFKATKGELPHMFYNITLSHHHCIVLATRPLVIWLLIRSLPPSKFDQRILSGPIAKLLEKSVQSATTTLLILINLLDRETLETFLPFPLEYTFSSAVLLTILSAILPTYVPDSGWHRAVSSIFDEMIRKGNIVAKLRRAELEHLEALVEPYRIQNSTMHSLQPAPHQDSAAVQHPFSGHPRALDVHVDHDQNPFRINWNDSQDLLEPFETGSDDIIALAEQLEHDDFSFTI
ncbi:hypothetical protein BDV27DRAFT_153465 [Aspergillus caelatus]|uniref:Zn(2)-C6 fungal-type domain-containing protein n=1 Tax=Aspergillus caelatus TaxID=61420 RepID=A0A5N7AJZ7_9EURO|nr:uncharacterized protein BDV27DRAFT_153465 [Aspergillus caelatus]KAE8369010.1 hypothetical protein BDV27DRAFT_153465 [Aspergillus caelatus]